MLVAIIGALEQEVAGLRKHIVAREVKQVANHQIDVGLLHNIPVALIKAGVGKVAAAVGTTLLLEYHKPTLVINTGTAGSLSSSLQIGDIVISSQICHHDADLTAMGYPLGQMSNCPHTFTAHRQTVDLLHACCANLPYRVVEGLICSGDTFVSGLEKKQLIRQNFPTALAVEMEAASIAQVCNLYQVPWVAVRSISDCADGTAAHNFQHFLTKAAARSCNLVKSLLQQME